MYLELNDLKDRSVGENVRNITLNMGQLWNNLGILEGDYIYQFENDHKQMYREEISWRLQPIDFPVLIFLSFSKFSDLQKSTNFSH